MKPTHLWMLLACVIFSCTPIKKAISTETNLPSIAAIGKQDNSLLDLDFKQVGEPAFTTAIALSVDALPFTKSKFKTYQNVKAQRGERMDVQYIDSLPIKPKYLHFEIKDKIGLKTLLNASENDEVRSYLTKDVNCKIVSSISLYMDERQAEMYLTADGLFLTTSSDNMLRLELIIGKKKTYVNLPKDEIFDYQLMGFCWGENIYGKPQIETLNTHGKCPEGTEKNARKLDEMKSFLKI